MAALGYSLDKNWDQVGLLISTAAIGITIVFWFLDRRNRNLIEIGENIIDAHWRAADLDQNLNPITQARKTFGTGLRFATAFGAMYFSALALAGASLARLVAPKEFEWLINLIWSLTNR